MAARMSATMPKVRLRAGLRIGLAALACGLFGFGGASAYIGESYLELPGLVGDGGGKQYRNWLRIEAHYWKSTDEGGIFAGAGRRPVALRGTPYFSYSAAPRTGGDALVISIDKRSPMLLQMMAQCDKRAVLPSLRFAESSDRARFGADIGPRPSHIPDHYEYELSAVQFVDCPVVQGAPEQAFVLGFKNIRWLNAQGERDGKAVYGEEIDVLPASLPAVQSTGTTKTFVISWFAHANDVRDDQCPNINAKPKEDTYFAYMTPQQAVAEREALKGRGGISFEDGTMARRGPARLNACLLPGIVPNPGHFAPQTTVARGIDLDGDNGTGKAPAGSCRHKNYSSPDGRPGIDNQAYTVMGCMPGYQGHKGFLMQYRNEQRRNGLLSVLFQISGIDDEKNDDNVTVAILYSRDPMAKNADGSRILHDYTYRLASEPRYTHFFTRAKGRIVNGAIVTEPVKTLHMVLGIDPQLTLHEARMRLEIMPDGSLKGVLGGYEDWRKYMALNSNSNSENLYGFQCPGLYHALKNGADGLKDPVTGECNGISVAYDVEGSPAFIPTKQLQTLVAQADARTQRIR